MKRIRLTLKPGQPGTKGCERTHQRVKTVELIVERTNWAGESRRVDGESMVRCVSAGKESELRRKVKTAGGKWDPVKRVWLFCRERWRVWGWRVGSLKEMSDVDRRSGGGYLHVDGLRAIYM